MLFMETMKTRITLLVLVLTHSFLSWFSSAASLSTSWLDPSDLTQFSRAFWGMLHHATWLPLLWPDRYAFMNEGALFGVRLGPFGFLLNSIAAVGLGYGLWLTIRKSVFKAARGRGNLKD